MLLRCLWLLLPPPGLAAPPRGVCLSFPAQTRQLRRDRLQTLVRDRIPATLAPISAARSEMARFIHSPKVKPSRRAASFAASRASKSTPLMLQGTALFISASRFLWRTEALAPSRPGRLRLTRMRDDAAVLTVDFLQIG